MQNDVMYNMANGYVTALTLLNIFATFDTVDHTTLLDRLYKYYGISNLTGSNHNCLTESNQSRWVTLCYILGVEIWCPQGCFGHNTFLSVHLPTHFYYPVL